MKTAVIILNWNGQKLLEEFLPTVLQHSLSDDTKVVVADNGSTDNSVEYLKTNFPEVPLIIFEENYGFADGYNKAIEQVDAEYVVLLNSDVETTPDWISTLINYMDENPGVAAVQPKILAQLQKSHFEYAGAAGGYIDRYGYPFCRGRILGNLEEDRGQYDTQAPIFWATGACLCIRRKDYLNVGGLDGRFFAHMEEIDLCWRLNARGYIVECVPQSTVYHVGGASLAMESPRKTYLNFRNNLLMLYKNVPSDRLAATMFVRFFLDILAFVHFLVRGKANNAMAVVGAFRDYLKMKPEFRDSRNENQQKAITKHIGTIYNKSILWSYYALGKRRFSNLNR